MTASLGRAAPDETVAAADPRHVGAAVGQALALFQREPTAARRHRARLALAAELRAQLPRGGRQSLAWSALAACDEDDALGVVENLFPELEAEPAQGPPEVPLLMERLCADARLWAAAASRRERLAYTLLGMLIGYTCVFTDDQSLDLRCDALQLTTCTRLFEEEESGRAGTKRPAVETALAYLRPDDQLVMWKIDRLGCSLREMLDTAHKLQE